MDALYKELEALRSAGGSQVDPVRFCYAESLLSRAAGQKAAARQKLERKVEVALEACREAVDASSAVTPQGASLSESLRGLAELVQSLSREAPTPDQSSSGFEFDQYLQHQENQLLLDLGDPADDSESSAASTLSLLNWNLLAVSNRRN